MPAPSYRSAAHLFSKLPTELRFMIIAQLPIESLLQAARVCLEFQLEAEVHIYRSIKFAPNWQRRAQKLQSTLTKSRRRQGLVHEICFLLDQWGGFYNPALWADVVDFLLSTLPNIKSLAIPMFQDEDSDLRSDLFIRPTLSLEKFSINIIEEWDSNPLEFFESQPSIRKLCILKDCFEVESFPNHLLPNLEELECTIPLLTLLAPGRPISKVCLTSFSTVLALKPCSYSLHLRWIYPLQLEH